MECERDDERKTAGVRRKRGKVPPAQFHRLYGAYIYPLKGTTKFPMRLLN